MLTNNNNDEKETYLETSLNCSNCKKSLSWVWRENVSPLLICKNGHKFSKVVPVFVKDNTKIIHADGYDFYIQ